MKNYFEGWYFKQQLGNDTVAFIPAMHTDMEKKTASLQIVTDKDAFCISHPAEDLHFCRKNLLITLGRSRFSLDGIHLEVRTKELEAVGDLHFESLQRPAHDIMGPFRYVPFMECRHSVFSMRHKVSGTLALNGRTMRYDKGEGYIEGDRGCSFPKRYLWSQCCFEDGSLMLSVADIPFLGGTFTGIIGLILYRGQEHRLATYRGAKAVKIGSGFAVVRQGGLSLTVEQLDGSDALLPAPVQGVMTRFIHESISCRVHYRFCRGEEVIFDFVSDQASFENEYEAMQP